jgi:hypothetical protein
MRPLLTLSRRAGLQPLIAGTACLILLTLSARADLTYTDVTASAGISLPGLGSGTAWADLDGDGDYDLLISDSSYFVIKLYRNDGGVFTDVTSASGITGEARNFAVGDFDNDGLEDVAAISFGYLPTKLFHNLGGMHFQDVSQQAGINGTYGWRISWIDYDRDGRLDLFQCGDTSYLYHNRGDGTFEEVAAAAHISQGGRSCAWVDYDNDGWPDCYCGVYSGGNRLYRNNGDGTFVEVGAAAHVNDSGNAEGVCAGDYDGDGWFDLYSVDISSASNRLYHNLGNGTFQDVTSQAGVGDVGDGRTGTFLDIDFDGFVDLFSSNHVNSNRLYRNNGAGTFTDIAAQIHLQNPPDPFGTGFADYDGDGDLDVFLTTHFGNALLRCDGMANHWIHLRLVGTVSNRDAIGAVVRCRAGMRAAYGRVDGGHGMGDFDSLPLEFGLGAATQADEVTVWWPSGLVQTWSALPADRLVVLTEGENPEGIDPGAGGPGGGDAARQVSLRLTLSPNPACDFVQCRIVTGSLSPASTEPAGAMSQARQARWILFDPAGRVLAQRRISLGREPGELSLDLSNLDAGTYFCRVETGGATATGRLVVLR